MSTPVTLVSSAAPAAPAAPGATGDSGSLFGEVLSGFSTENPQGEVTEEMLDAMLASGSAPLGGALLAGLNLPIGDARTPTGATEASPLPGVAQAAPGRGAPAAATGLTGTLAGSVAGAAVPASTAAPATGAVSTTAPAESVVRVATGSPGIASSTVDTAVPSATGPAVDTAVRSGNAFGDTRSGQERGEGALSRGPESGWAPALAAARADNAVPTTQASPATGQAPAPAPQLPPAAQLALRLAPLRAGPDGTHQLTIVLHPEELGPVRVVATVKGDQLTVQLTGATETGRDALRAALPQLERDLRDGGFTTLNLNVRETPQTDPVRPTWATAAATSATTPAQQPVQQPTSQPTPAATPVAPTATDYATNGTAATTTGTKNDSQPAGQVLQPDGTTSGRQDAAAGQYNAAGVVTATHQSSGSQFGNTGQQQSQQQSAQLNLGQPNSQSGHQPTNPGFADHQQHGGRHPGTGVDNGPGPQAGDFEPDPRIEENRAEHRTGTRSVDLRV